jgi:hypothetical protein
MWSWTVINILFPKIRNINLLFSDISFLCEATAAIMTLEQQNKPSVQQRTTDKSAIRAAPKELQHEPVCYMFK